MSDTCVHSASPHRVTVHVLIDSANDNAHDPALRMLSPFADALEKSIFVLLLLLADVGDLVSAEVFCID